MTQQNWPKFVSGVTGVAIGLVTGLITNDRTIGLSAGLISLLSLLVLQAVLYIAHASKSRTVGVTVAACLVLVVAVTAFALHESTDHPATTAAGTVTLNTPANEASVQGCAVFQGTSNHLSPDMTIVLAMHNDGTHGEGNGDSGIYLEAVDGWDNPSQLSSWSGRQYFDPGDGSSEGQQYDVKVYTAPTDDVRNEQPQTGPWDVPAVPADWKFQQSVEVTRAADSGTADCGG